MSVDTQEASCCGLLKDLSYLVVTTIYWTSTGRSPIMSLTVILFELAIAPVLLALAALLVNIIRGVISRFTKYVFLRRVNGPKRRSFVAGNLQDLYGPAGLAHLEALSEYGSIAKVPGLFGVRLHSLRSGFR